MPPMFHAIFVNNLRVRGVSEKVSSRTLARRPNTPNLGKKHPSGGWGLMSAGMNYTTVAMCYVFFMIFKYLDFEIHIIFSTFACDKSEKLHENNLRNKI